VTPWDDYFCFMKQLFRAAVVLAFYFNTGHAQTRLSKLALLPKQEYRILGSDVISIDTLILGDSSRLVLNPQAKTNIINVALAIIGKGCVIYGKGEKGESGKRGRDGATQRAPCSNGSDGSESSTGVIGKDGLNLFFYFSKVKISGSLQIDLTGADGGNGGVGGDGGDGGSGTSVCKGGNGGNGGRGGNGGAAGAGGSLFINCKKCPDIHSLKDQLIIKNYGGFGGLGGNGGSGGQAGFGRLGGKNGKRGMPGMQGAPGKKGAVTLEQK